MSKLRLAPICLWLAVAGSSVVLSGIAPSAAAQAKTEKVRPQVGAPLRAAQDLIKAQKYREALAKIAETDAIGDKTDWEIVTIERMRGAAAMGAGDIALTGKSYEAAVASGRLPAPEQLEIVNGLGSLYYNAKDYPKAIIWLSRALKDGGNDPLTRSLLIQAYYFNNDISRAASELQSDVAADEGAGRAPGETALKLLVSCAIKINDNAAYLAALEKLNTYYPKKAYWADLLNGLQAKPGFPERLALDAYRLKAAAGQLRTSAEFMDLAQLALQAGFPAEAKKIMDQGFQSGLLGAGADSAVQKRLRDLAAKNAADDLKTMALGEAEAAGNKDGAGLVNLGYAYVSAGEFNKGIALMEQGIGKGGFKRPEDAKLHIGIAYLQAGRATDAIRMLKTVQGADGTAELARYWTMLANHPVI